MPTSLAPARVLHAHYDAEPSGATRLRRPHKWRRWWVAAAAVAVVVVVVADFPIHASGTYRRATLQGYLHTVAGDVAQCRVALHDAVLAYVGSVVGHPAVAPGIPALFTSQGIADCGFADGGVVDLGETAPPRSITSPTVDHIAPQVDAWAYLDAFTLLQDLRQVIAHPGASGPRQAFATELRALETRRRAVDHLVVRAERSTGAPVRPPALTSVVSLLPDGRLPARRSAGK